jgi:hypothetical protein
MRPFEEDVDVDGAVARVQADSMACVKVQRGPGLGAKKARLIDRDQKQIGRYR